MAAPKQEPRTKQYTQKLKKYAAKNAKYTMAIKHGSDKNKKNKSGKAIDRGVNTYCARQCSSHIRTVYPSNILLDGNKTEFCVNSRSDECMNNECKLCGIEHKHKWQSTVPINIAEAIGGKKATKERLLADMLYYFGTNYPNSKKYRILRVKKNGNVIIEYYIKLIPFSSLLKTAAPSGYKYKDRTSLSKCIKIQAKDDKDIIFCIKSSAVHCVGFWDLLNDCGIRTLVQLNQVSSLDVCFSFLIDNNSTDTNTIDVDLICNRNGMDNKLVPLWHWDRPDRDRDSLQRNNGSNETHPVCINPINYQQQHLCNQYSAVQTPNASNVNVNGYAASRESNVNGYAAAFRDNPMGQHPNNSNNDNSFDPLTHFNWNDIDSTSTIPTLPSPIPTFAIPSMPTLPFTMPISASPSIPMLPCPSMRTLPSPMHMGQPHCNMYSINDHATQYPIPFEPPTHFNCNYIDSSTIPMLPSPMPMLPCPSMPPLPSISPMPFFSPSMQFPCHSMQLDEYSEMKYPTTSNTNICINFQRDAGIPAIDYVRTQSAAAHHQAVMIQRDLVREAGYANLKGRAD